MADDMIPVYLFRERYHKKRQAELMCAILFQTYQVFYARIDVSAVGWPEPWKIVAYSPADSTIRADYPDHVTTTRVSTNVLDAWAKGLDGYSCDRRSGYRYKREEKNRIVVAYLNQEVVHR